MEVDEDLDVSVVLPVYNERGHLRTEIERIQQALAASPYSFEIIVVDDGSDDGSETDLPTIEGIRLIRHSRNRGPARPAGPGRWRRGRVVVWTDVDMTYPNDEIPDARQGARRLRPRRRRPAHRGGTQAVPRVPAKWFIRKLASYLVETDIPDLNSGLRAFRRDVAMQYVHQLPAGFSCVTTLTMSFLANGYSVKYVPIDYFPRAGTRSSTGGGTPSATCSRSCRMTLSYNPLKVFLPIGGAARRSASASSSTTGSTRTSASPPTPC